MSSTRIELAFHKLRHAIDDLVMAGTNDEVHEWLERGRKHLDARRYQTRPADSTLPEPDYECAQQSVLTFDDNEDLL